MFTGIIQDVGQITAIRSEAEQTHITVQTTLDTTPWQLGDSVAVDGCCLTITAKTPHTFSATLSKETLSMTHFAHARMEQRVNLEPALCVGDPLGGHIVTGHIDGLIHLDAINAIGEHQEMIFSLPKHLGQYALHKGSIAINGISLTINRVQDCQISVNIIPHTLVHTNLGTLQIGDDANVETDMLGRYVERILNYRENT